MKAVVLTLGCKVNECESEGLMSALKDSGYEVYDKLTFADLYIVNTCAVTQEAEKKSRQMASKILKLNKNAKIIWTGCASQNNPQSFLEKLPNCLVTGVFNKGESIKLIDQSGIHIAPPTREYQELPFAKGLNTRSYIKVQDGCDNFCSYCLIPYLRGRQRSRDPKSVISEMNALNPTEAVINGINLSAYNFNGVNLTGLINSLNGVDCRIRLGSLEQAIIDQPFLTALKNLKNFAPHFHLSLQSGSDEVLKSMNRKYKVSQFINQVKLIRQNFPSAGITTDIIVGFPTETEQDFIKTINLVKQVEFSDIHVFVFSPRKGTVAYKMKDIPHQEKKRREKILIELKDFYKNKFIKSQVNKNLQMLVEDFKDGYLRGYSENYIRLYLPIDSLEKTKIENLQGKIVSVKVNEPLNDGATCTLNNK